MSHHLNISTKDWPPKNGDKIVKFDVLVADGFVLTEFAAVTDALRIANRVSPEQVFSWTCRSHSGNPVTSSSGASVDTQCFNDSADADYVFVIGNTDPASPALSLGGTIRNYTYRGAQVFLLAEAASRYLKDKGGEANGLVTHWENSLLLRETMEVFDAGTCIASKDGSIVTCAGMGATLDIVLATIGRHLPTALTMTVASIFLHEHIRDFSTQQLFEGTNGVSTGDSYIDRAIKIMLSNIEDPTPIGEIVQELGISSRSLERRFKSNLNATPLTYYKGLRLTRANNLLLNTTMSVRDIGLATGFGCTFPSAYKKMFGLTPNKMRKRRI